MKQLLNGEQLYFGKNTSTENNTIHLSNKKNIIFITQNALFTRTQNYELTLFFKWISDFYLFINSCNIYWLCSNPCVFESGIINISNDNTNILNITQYIIGTGGSEQEYPAGRGCPEQ